jgi:hypothetical protein
MIEQSPQSCNWQIIVVAGSVVQKFLVFVKRETLSPCSYNSVVGIPYHQQAETRSHIHNVFLQEAV